MASAAALDEPLPGIELPVSFNSIDEWVLL